MGLLGSKGCLGREGYLVSKWGNSYGHIANLWFDFSCRLDVGSLDLVTVTCYRLWLGRNDLIFRNNFRGPKGIINVAISDIEDFSLAQTESVVRPETELHLVKVGHWQPPAPSWLNVNFDVSFLKTE